MTVVIYFFNFKYFGVSKYRLLKRIEIENNEIGKLHSFKNNVVGFVAGDKFYLINMQNWMEKTFTVPDNILKDSDFQIDSPVLTEDNYSAPKHPKLWIWNLDNNETKAVKMLGNVTAIGPLENNLLALSEYRTNSKIFVAIFKFFDGSYELVMKSSSTHTGTVHQMLCLPNNNFASVSQGEIHFWNCDLQLIRIVGCGHGKIENVQYIKCSKYLMRYEYSIFIWDSNTDNKQYLVNGSGSDLSLFTKDLPFLVLFGKIKKEIQFYDSTYFKLIRTYENTNIQLVKILRNCESAVYASKQDRSVDFFSFNS